MAEVNISINGRSYGIACDDGQENRVAELGRFIDERVRDIAGAGAAAGESHLLVLTALVLADEIYDLREHINALMQGGSAGAQDQIAQNGMNPDEEQMIATAIETLAGRIDSIAGRITQTH